MKSVGKGYLHVALWNYGDGSHVKWNEGINPGKTKVILRQIAVILAQVC